MPSFNFQARFADAVESGTKTQTIRAMRKDGRDAKVGQTLYLFTGMRTKQCRKLGEGICTSVRRLTLTVRHPATRNVNFTLSDPFWLGSSRSGGRDQARFTRLAHRDGFETADEMAAWFEKAHGLPFTGQLYSWELEKEAK